MSNTWERGKIKWISPDCTCAFAASEMRYGGDVYLHVELYVGTDPAFEGHKPDDLVQFHTRMRIDGKQVAKEWKWE